VLCSQGSRERFHWGWGGGGAQLSCENSTSRHLPKRVSGYFSALVWAASFDTLFRSGVPGEIRIEKHYNNSALWLRCDKSTHTYTCCTCTAFSGTHEKITTPRKLTSSCCCTLYTTITNRNNKQEGKLEQAQITAEPAETVKVGLKCQEHLEKETKTPRGPNNLIIPAPQSKQKWQAQSVHCQWRLSFVKPIQEVGSQATRTMPSDKQEGSPFSPACHREAHLKY